MTELHEEIAAGQKRLLIIFAYGLPLAMTASIGASLRGGPTWLWVKIKATADAGISLSMLFNNYGIAAERIKTRLTLRFI